MKRLIIFLDYQSNYSDRAEKIANDVDIEVKYYYLEDFFKKNIKDDIFVEDVVYFLTNDDKIKDIVNVLPNKTILNKKYYINNYSKIEIQQKLFENGINTPKIIYDIDKLTNKDFPLYVKNRNHDVFVGKITSKRGFDYFFNRFNIDDFYLEEEIKKANILKEHKIYYVNNCVFENDEDTISNDIITTCHRLSDIIGLDIYSTDILETKDALYVIDVNTAPGFWYSKESRIKLSDYCK